jgi:hypothetical protein
MGGCIYPPFVHAERIFMSKKMQININQKKVTWLSKNKTLNRRK